MAAPPIRLMLLLVLALATPRTMDAQPRVPQARMDAFVRALADGDPAPFFPRRGGLAWVLTTHRADSVSVGRWRFDAADLPRAQGGGGPLCESFTMGGDVIPLHSLHYRARRTPGRWRRVGVNRFVPPGASAGSATFVQWRREDGRWVVDAFGNEVVLAPRLLGMQRGGVVRDPGGPLAYPLPADGVYAAGTWWYEQNEVITVDGARLHRYGPPRRLDPGSVRRFGYLEGVEIYVEPRYRRIPEVLFVAVSEDGVFQPYQNMAGDGCTAPAPPLAVVRDPGGPLAYPLPADGLYAARGCRAAS